MIEPTAHILEPRAHSQSPTNTLIGEQDLVHPEEKFHYPPARLEHFTAWLGEMWRVPAVKEYGLTPGQHMEFKRQMGQPLTNYDFLL